MSKGPNIIHNKSNILTVVSHNSINLRGSVESALTWKLRKKLFKMDELDMADLSCVSVFNGFNIK